MRLVIGWTPVDRKAALRTVAEMAQELWPLAPSIAQLARQGLLMSAVRGAQEAVNRLSDWTSDEAPRTGRAAQTVYFDAIEALGEAADALSDGDTDAWRAQALPAIGVVVEDWRRLDAHERAFAAKASKE